MRIRCTACSALLQVADEVAGKRIRCPRCKEVTVATAVPVEKRPPSSAAVRAESPKAKPRIAAAKAGTAVRSRNAEEDDAPRPKKKKKKRKKDNSSMFVGIAVAGGVTVCIAITAAIVAMTKPSPAAVAKAAPAIQDPKPRVDDPKQEQPKAANPVARKGPQKNAELDDDDEPVAKPQPKAPPGPPKVAAIPSKFTLPDSSDDAWLARKQDELKSMQRTLPEAYDKIGKRNPKWDAPARKALDLVARALADPEADPKPQSALPKLVDQAIRAGCDDPMIVYFSVQTSSVGPGASIEQVIDRYVKSIEKVRDSKYSPIHRSSALQSAAMVFLLTKQPKLRERGESLLEEAVNLFAAAAKEERNDDGLRARLGLDGLRLRVSAQAYLGESLAGFEFVDDILKKVPEAEGLRLKLKGDFLIGYAWEARGGGFAKTVTPDGWKLFHERLRQAHDVLESAWTLDPKDATTAARAITACKGLQLGDANAKKWFDRAMSADPGSRTACEELIDYLDPKWGGSREKLVAFGRECRKSKVLRSGIPLLLAEAHARAMMFQAPDVMESYMSSPEVWNEIAAVHDEYFAKCPDDVLAHASYAMYCSLVKKWDLASTHFQHADGAIPASLIFGADQFEIAREVAFRNHPPRN